MEVVQKFEMVWPDKEGNDPRGGKPPARKPRNPELEKNMSLARQIQVGDPTPQELATAGERLGLYKKSEKEFKAYDPLNEDHKVAPENLD